MIPPEKRARHATEKNKDRLSDLPDCVLLHILTFLNSKRAVQTCILSTRWKYLWKRIHTLKLNSNNFSTVKKFSIFVSKILTLRDSSTALHALDFYRFGYIFEYGHTIEPTLLKMILNHVSSHNTHLQELGINLHGDTSLIMSCVSSCRALTSLKLSLSHSDNYVETLFPKSMNLPLLTSLDLTNFIFCGGEKGIADPFTGFTKLNSLVICSCKTKDAQILRISSETLVILAMHYSSSNFAKVELSTPSLYTFSFPKNLGQKICGSGLSSVKQVNMDLQDFAASTEHALVLLSRLQALTNVESLVVNSITIQILSLVPDLFNVKLSSLYNLKSLEVQLIPIFHHQGLLHIMIKDFVNKAAAKSRKEAAELKKAFKAGLKLPPIPDGIVDFLRQNSPSTEVNITTKYPVFKEYTKGRKNTNHHTQSAGPASSSVVPASSSAVLASAAEFTSGTASAAPSSLHLCCSEKVKESIKGGKNPNHKLLEILFNKNIETEALHHSSIQDPPDTNIGNELNNQYLNNETVNNAHVDNDRSNNDIQEVGRSGKQKIQVKDHTFRKESTSHQMRNALVQQAQAW